MLLLSLLLPMSLLLLLHRVVAAAAAAALAARLDASTRHTQFSALADNTDIGAFILYPICAYLPLLLLPLCCPHFFCECC